MRLAHVVPVLAGLGMFCAFVLMATRWTVPVRHSAPYGFSQTVDFDRAIAVSGGYVTANYPNFDRLDLDLRAYGREATFDLTVHVRPAVEGAIDERTVRVRLEADEVFHVKGVFADPFVSVRFPAIRDSAGRTYYIWVERGPRNRDDVIALWSIKSYSTIRAGTVLSATVDGIPRYWGWSVSSRLVQGLMIVVAIAASTVFGMLMIPAFTGGHDSVRRRRGRWQPGASGGIQ